MKILLINPSTNDDILSGTVSEIPYLESEAFIAPHSVSTVAALAPTDHEVHIHDEQIKGPVESILLDGCDYDVLGISVMATQLSRTANIVSFFRERDFSASLVVGGIGVSHMPDDLKDRVDTVFQGEAETTWPTYLNDLQNGDPASSYQQDARTDMTQVPAPRWDLLGKDIHRYGAVPVQTTRGCPYQCNFCDVIQNFGRKPRSKTVEQVVDEIRTAERLGAKMVYLADDNFGGGRGFAKELLRSIEKLNNSFDEPLALMTQVDLTIANDDELLELMADSNMLQVQIGIESIDNNSLKDMNKVQNLRLDPVDACKKVQSYGIVIMAHMIVGADSDDPGVFERFEQFLGKASIVNHLCHPLSAPPGTELWKQLEAEGRLMAASDMGDRVDVLTNIVPKKMTRAELFEGMADYLDRIHELDDYRSRILGFIDGVSRRPRVKNGGSGSPRKRIRMLFKMFRFFLFQLGRNHRKVFLEILKATRKKGTWMMPRVFFAHTGFIMDQKRSRKVAELTRQQARLESGKPLG